MCSSNKREGSWTQNNSYDSNDPKKLYDLQPTDIDRALYENKEFVAVFGLGNRGEKGWKVSQGAGSKNTITVGGTLTTHPFSYFFKYDDKETPENICYVADFSAQGSGNARLINPDIVGPGVTIRSAASRDPTLQNGLNADGKTPLIDEDGKAPNNL